jgi:hypothetical protein
MSAIVQTLVFVVVGSFIVLLVSAVGFYVGKGVGSGVKIVLVSILAAVGLTNDTASTVARAVESVAIAVSAATVFVLFFPPTGILADYRPEDLFSLVGSRWLVLVVGGAAVSLATTVGLAVGARKHHTLQNDGGSEQREIPSVYPWEDR